MPTPRHSRDERGATVVMFALLAMVLLGVGAIAVDMGQVYAKRSALQSNVDMAVLAAAPEIDGTNSCTSEAIDAAKDYLTKAGNSVDGQASLDLTDGVMSNGEINCIGWRVELTAPEARVDFGLAKALSETNSGVDVPAFAAAEIKSASGSLSLPMYAVSGCDYGSQQLADPPPGPPADPTVPDLIPDSETVFNNASFTISPTEVIPPIPPSQVLTLTGSNLGSATKVGFTSAGGDHEEVLDTDLAVTPTSIELDVPADVLTQGGVWWVRVFKDGKWSKEDDAQPFVVGDLLFCDGAISGNFGTLKIARLDPNWTLERNIMHGIEPTLDLYPDLSATACDDGVSPAITSETTPNDGTNCLGTDPGFSNSAATEGLVTGKGSEIGRLDKDTTPGCSRAGGDSRTVTTPGPQGRPINDDLLTCFIIDDSVSIQDVVDGEPKVLSADILKSPRFFMLPVLPTEAENGSSNFYPIIDFRPGFITDQPLHATPAAPAVGSISAYNGVEFQSNFVEELNVVLFDEAALPEEAPAVGGEEDYTGSGIKVIVLVD